MGALSSLLTILDSADKLAHQNRARETTVFCCARVTDGVGRCASYNVFPTIYVNREVCVRPKRRVNFAVSPQRVEYSWILFNDSSRKTIHSTAPETCLRFSAEGPTPDLVITTKLIAWINGWRCLSHVSNGKRICSAVAMIGSILPKSPESQTPGWQPRYPAGGQAGDLSCDMWQRHWNEVQWSVWILLLWEWLTHYVKMPVSATAGLTAGKRTPRLIDLCSQRSLPTKTINQQNVWLILLTPDGNKPVGTCSWGGKKPWLLY